MNQIEMEKEMELIKSRNVRVEADKAWEMSWFRRAFLAICTYLAIGIYLRAVEIPEPWLNAIVPAVAFMLSTLTLPYLKKVWIKFIYKR